MTYEEKKTLVNTKYKLYRNQNFKNKIGNISKMAGATITANIGTVAILSYIENPPIILNISMHTVLTLIGIIGGSAFCKEYDKKFFLPILKKLKEELENGNNINIKPYKELFEDKTSPKKLSKVK